MKWKVLEVAPRLKVLSKWGTGVDSLDVFEEEPLSKNSPLLRMDNVLLSPHNANSSSLYWEKIHRRTIDNLLAVLGGR
ncbi:hypothetical protein DSECCO2_514250 [anaerobic digester metagenome]